MTPSLMHYTRRQLGGASITDYVFVVWGQCIIISEIQYQIFMEAAEAKIVDDIKTAIVEQEKKTVRMEEIARKIESNV